VGAPRAKQPPPEEWEWPEVGMPMRVEVEHEGRAQWCPAAVMRVRPDGAMEVTIRDAAESWEDTFTWRDEGVDWTRDISEEASTCPLPPDGWSWLTEGERLEVEVEHEDVSQWWPAIVTMVLATGAFEAEISDENDTWTDWLTWRTEGQDWRRTDGDGDPPIADGDPPDADDDPPIASDAGGGTSGSANAPAKVRPAKRSRNAPAAYVPAELENRSSARVAARPRASYVEDDVDEDDPPIVRGHGAAAARGHSPAAARGHGRSSTRVEAPPRVNDVEDPETAALAAGDRIEAKYMAQQYGGARTKWYPGFVIAVHEVGRGADSWSSRMSTSFDIRFDDGDREKQVPRRFIRLLARRR